MASPSIVRHRLLISGAVQGVGFRYWATRESAAFQVTGYVRNLYDGSVEAVLEGPAGEVSGFERVLRKGPPYGRVHSVQTVEEEPTGEFSSFGVKF
jgi:acylphosphatase